MSTIVSNIFSTIVSFVNGIKYGFASGCEIVEWLCTYGGPAFGAIARYINKNSEAPVVLRNRSGGKLISDMEAQHSPANDADFEELIRVRQEIKTLKKILDNRSARTRPGTSEAHEIQLDRFELERKKVLNDIAIEAQIRATYPARALYLAMCETYDVAPVRTD
ncbi:hypothetical protein JR316_0000030 [Psilocybe cubensis]|uniref:Uncharacterized protein n=9 Tax=Psilocybe cubensis TaxID=181762 RepID=A0A8H8CFD0_PSICU|nr:hypothetical protein JR316_0011926 [Psilocybe cubensis]XP_047743990.1 hypothetical protein JR316_0011940 [Psilocybe cubensis]XP_047745549.1 hypothetical protein JR316_0010156 [Psilocybe cubensis]XP_047750932.1 hypothetical protein JR316_0005413 [Psilocybe cubensis]XP_047751629.1 hypothetical protein JR316_0003483 [Psilocybe cubensis]XP_047751644.1 hypothetical protein JR316_0003498 [Psilocybe cubensis]XP_047753577.1 hypothetical protein JR316_0000013 [Psilocybe cubensis]XP_047753594.1 hyp